MKNKITLLFFLLLSGLMLSACNLPKPTPAGKSLPATIAPAATTVSAPQRVPSLTDTAAPSKIPATLTKIPVKTSPAAPEKTATKTPTKAPTQTPTKTATTIATGNFSTNGDNSVPPADVLEEVTYGGMGGGPTCLVAYPAPVMASSTKEAELVSVAELGTCGWKPGQRLTGKVTYPDGRTYVKEISVSEFQSDFGMAVLEFVPLISDPVGIYLFEITDGSVTFAAKVKFRLPDGPRLYKLNDQQLLFYNFTPQEKVRLFMYSCREGSSGYCELWGFSSWQKFQIGENGQLLVNAPVAGNYFVAITQAGKEIRFITADPNYESLYSTIYNILQPVTCKGLKSRLYVGGKARVAFVDGSKTRIRKSPGFSREILYTVPEGTQVTITGGPKCANNSTWWQVRTKSGQIGWMAEYQNKTYLLEPWR